MNQKKLLLKVIDDVKGSNKEKWVHFCYVPEEVYTRFLSAKGRNYSTRTWKDGPRKILI